MPTIDELYSVAAASPADPPRSNGSSGKTAKAFATLDLFANWKPETGPLAGTQIQAGIDNVFNADFRENLAYDRSSGRTFKISLSKQFDY
nr:TonB-dependent receptor [Devosia sp. MC521]